MKFHTKSARTFRHALQPGKNSQDWRCSCCGKLLGICSDGSMHLRFARGPEYFVGFPVTAKCPGCGTLNLAKTPLR
jgi:phage FluMu protein Com